MKLALIGLLLAGCYDPNFFDRGMRTYPAGSTIIFRSGQTASCNRGVEYRPINGVFTCLQHDGRFTVGTRDVSSVKAVTR